LRRTSSALPQLAGDDGIAATIAGALRIQMLTIEGETNREGGSQAALVCVAAADGAGDA
jgi:hypothetical protein